AREAVCRWHVRNQGVDGSGRRHGRGPQGHAAGRLSALLPLARRYGVRQRVRLLELVSESRARHIREDSLRLVTEHTHPLAQTISLEDAELLSRVDLFIGLDRVALAQLAARLERVEVLPGRDVVVQGEPGDAMYIVAEGDLEVAVRADDGAEAVIAVH